MRAYVLKRGEGEKLFGGSLIIKASPRSGSERTEMFWNAMAPGQSTGVHVHLTSDEFFYVIAGSGTALVDQKDAPIKAGDSIFIPKGEDHRIRSSADDPLELLFLVDVPGLAGRFRDAHLQFEERGEWHPTLEQLNAIAEKYGTIYKTLD